MTLTTPDHHSRGRGGALRQEIEGLRALAVIFVIVNHFNHNLMPSGYLGVDVFFVISGYVITLSMAGRRPMSLGGFLLDFYARRVKRLLPALILCVVVSSVLICMLDPEPNITLRTGAAALFGLSNLYLLKQSTDYFAPSTVLNVFTQTWSLGVEEQFYLVFPLLVWLTGQTRLAGGSRVLTWLMSALSIASLGAFVQMSRTHPQAAYFLMPTRFWELGAGCLVFLASRHFAGPRLEPLARKVFPALLFAVLVGCLFLPQRLGLPATVLAVTATALLIGLVRPQTPVHTLLTTGILVRIGAISYSLYLWHWTVLCISRWTIDIRWWTAPFQLALMFALAGASYRYLENPLRSAGWSKSAGRSIGYGVAASLLATGLVATLRTHHAAVLAPGRVDLLISAAFLPLKTSGMPFDPTCVVDDDRRPLTDKTFDLCTVAPTRPDGQTIWALGDSNAGHLQGLLYAVHDLTGVGVHLIETPGRPFPLRADQQFAPRDTIYDTVRARLKPGDIVLISRKFVLPDGEVPDEVFTWIDALAPLARQVSASGASLLVVGPIPTFRFENIALCLSAMRSHADCNVERRPLAMEAGKVHQRLAAVAAAQPNMQVFDQFSLLCPPADKTCSPYQGDRFLFRDRNHLNARGSASLAEPFVGFLRNRHLLAAHQADSGPRRPARPFAAGTD